MKSCAIGAAFLLLISAADAQDQSACPSPRHNDPINACASGGDTKRDITVRVTALHVDPGKYGFELMADTAEKIQGHQYRACDMGLEITNQVKDSFQRLGYFCTDLDPIPAAQTAKNEYEIALRVHPGPQFRLGAVVYSGATLMTPDELHSTFRMKENSVFDTASVRRGLEALQKAYSKHGHPLASIVPAVELDQNNRTVRLKIEIVEGTTPQ